VKSVKKIASVLILALVIVSCASDTKLSEEEIKAANEAMKYNSPHQWNTWPYNTWNNGIPGTKRIQFGKDLPSISTQNFQKTEGMKF